MTDKSVPVAGETPEWVTALRNAESNLCLGVSLEIEKLYDLYREQLGTIETLTETMMNIRTQREEYADKCEGYREALEYYAGTAHSNSYRARAALESGDVCGAISSTFTDGSACDLPHGHDGMHRGDDYRWAESEDEG